MTESAETRWEAHNEAGRRLLSQGDLAAAEQEFVAAIREATLLGADNVRLASSLSGLGQIKYRQKDLDQAEALFRRALAIRERVLGADHFSLVQAINNLAALYYSRSDLDRAAKHFTRALEICDKNLGEKHPDVAVTLNNLARLHFRRNDYVAAAPLLMRLLAIKQEAVGVHHPEVAAILTSLAKVRLAEGQHEDAEQLARRALLIREDIHQAGDPAIATSLEMLAEVMAARGLLDEEQRLRKRAEQIRAGLTGHAQSAGSGSAAARATIPPAFSPQPQVELTSASLTTDSTSYPTETHQPVASNASSVRRSGDVGPSDVGPSGDPATERLPAVQVSGALPAKPSDPPERGRTTRSASLPWIEAPTSPALRRPKSGPITAPRPVPPTAAGTPRPRATATTPGPATRGAAPARGAAPPRKAPTAASMRAPSSIAGPVSDRPYRARREVILEARQTSPGRSWLKVVIAAALLLGCGAGAWVYLTGHGAAERITSSAGAALEPSAQQSASTPGNEGDRDDSRAGYGARDGASPSALTASPDPAYAGSPPAREAPPAAAYADAPARRVPGARTEVPAASHEADAGEMATTPPALSTPDLSRINVDKITTAIGQNARARADSLGRKTITVKPPDFGKPQP